MEWVRQRTDEDCGCAALAILLGMSYEAVADAWRAALGREPNRSTYADLISVASHLGYRLARARARHGIRRVRPEPYTKHSHWVVLADGWVYCPTRGIFWEDHYPWQAWGSGLELDKTHASASNYPSIYPRHLDKTKIEASP